MKLGAASTAWGCMAERTAPELLSPAGDSLRLRAALLYGADAVYLAGQKFGLRSGCRNFDDDSLPKAVQFAHRAGAKVYLTCNTLPRNEDLKALPAFLERAECAGADALIVTDIGILPMCARYAPHCALHISTQFGVVNYATAQSLYELGAKRVILARELSLDEIADIRAHTPKALELEAFVHGAMCMAISGRCMFSAYLTGRDGNRGDCSQPCRWGYRFVEPHNPSRVMSGVETDGSTYLFNANDLNMLAYVPQLMSAGVDAFKIEGRAKAAYYTAVITNAYRTAIDGCLACEPHESYVPPDWLLSEPDKVSHRPYSTGFYFGDPSQNTAFGGYVREWEVAAVVEDYRDRRLYLRQRNRVGEGETLEALAPSVPPFAVAAVDLRDGDGNAISETPHPDMAFSLPCERELPPGALLRRRREKGGHTV